YAAHRAPRSCASSSPRVHSGRGIRGGAARGQGKRSARGRRGTSRGRSWLSQSLVLTRRSRQGEVAVLHVKIGIRCQGRQARVVDRPADREVIERLEGKILEPEHPVHGIVEEATDSRGPHA